MAKSKSSSDQFANSSLSVDSCDAYFDLSLLKSDEADCAFTPCTCVSYDVMSSGIVCQKQNELQTVYFQLWMLYIVSFCCCCCCQPLLLVQKKPPGVSPFTAHHPLSYNLALKVWPKWHSLPDVLSRRFRCRLATFLVGFGGDILHYLSSYVYLPIEYYYCIMRESWCDIKWILHLELCMWYRSRFDQCTAISLMRLAFTTAKDE